MTAAKIFSEHLAAAHVELAADEGNIELKLRPQEDLRLEQRVALFAAGGWKCDEDDDSDAVSENSTKDTATEDPEEGENAESSVEDAAPSSRLAQIGTGTLFLTTERFLWVPDHATQVRAAEVAPAEATAEEQEQKPANALAFPYRSVVIHAVSTDRTPEVLPYGCMYCQVDSTLLKRENGEISWEQAEMEQERGCGYGMELRFVPVEGQASCAAAESGTADADITEAPGTDAIVKDMFDGLSAMAQLHPDNIDGGGDADEGADDGAAGPSMGGLGGFGGIDLSQFDFGHGFGKGLDGNGFDPEKDMAKLFGGGAVTTVDDVVDDDAESDVAEAAEAEA